MGIVGAPTMFPAGHRILGYGDPTGSGNMEYSDDLAVSSSDSVFGFLEGSVGSVRSNEEVCCYQEEFDDEEGEEGENSFDENQKFWETQQNNLQATLCRTTSLETGIRHVTREAMKELQERQGHYCNCGKTMARNNCRRCLMREVSGRLRVAGYNAAVCRTKWRSSPEIPSGEHTFIDVVDNSSSKKGEVRVIIELSFKADFEMARASDEYNQLIGRLPEVFVGKSERLKALIKILCTATKKCMKDKKMHMGPWRKQKYMLAKWFSTNYERIEQSNSPINSNQISKPARRASMLTRALMDMPMKAVAVV